MWNTGHGGRPLQLIATTSLMLKGKFSIGAPIHSCCVERHIANIQAK